MKEKKASDPRRRVVVTGLGVVSSIGIGVEPFWKNLLAGKSGISEITSFDTSAYPVHKGGEVKDFHPEQFIDKRKLKHLGRASQMAIAATQLAISDGKLKKKDLEQAGVFFGTTLGESPLIEEMNEDLARDDHESIDRLNVFLYPINSIPTHVAIAFDIHGINFMIPTACASGNYAAGYAFDLIRRGEVDVALAGASDAFSRIAFTGFSRLYAMAPDKCQPFDKNRKGMMLGEGSGVLLLESSEHAEKRGAKIYAEILGYGLSCDAHHMTQPSEDGITRCIKKALRESGISTEDVDYVSAHGTGTPQNDKTECAALKTVFGNRLKDIPCSSIKSMLGHAMGAASAMESISCCLAIRDSRLPPTINFDTADEECPIDCVPNKSRQHELKTALNNSCAFGGDNATIAFSYL